MNSFTNTILSLLLGWVRALLNAARDFISSDSSTAFLTFFQDNWRILFVILCIIGFALDNIVYLIRWRPRLLHRRRRKKRTNYEELPPAEENYALPEYDEELPPAELNPYVNTAAVSPADASAPTAQYQMQPRPNKQAYQTQPVTMQYTMADTAPEAMQNPYTDTAPALYTDEPAHDAQQRFAFGMAPSFGSAQSEPTYPYQQSATPSFAPPQYAQPYSQQPSYTPRQSEPEYADDTFTQTGYHRPNQAFRPFSDRQDTSFAPQKTKGLGAVAKKARFLLNADEANESLSYKDIQPAIDVSEAFHSPVYPKQNPNEDA